MPVSREELDKCEDHVEEALEKYGPSPKEYAKTLKAGIKAKHQKVFMPAGAKRPVYSAKMIDYAARLSYAQELRAVRGWGRPPPRQTLLNGEGFSITINLETHQQASDDPS